MARLTGSGAGSWSPTPRRQLFIWHRRCRHVYHDTFTSREEPRPGAFPWRRSEESRDWPVVHPSTCIQGDVSGLRPPLLHPRPCPGRRHLLLRHQRASFSRVVLAWRRGVGARQLAPRGTRVRCQTAGESTVEGRGAWRAPRVFALCFVPRKNSFFVPCRLFGTDQNTPYMPMISSTPKYIYIFGKMYTFPLRILSRLKRRSTFQAWR